MRPISLSTHEKSFLIIHSTYFKSNVNTNSSLTTLYTVYIIRKKCKGLSHKCIKTRTKEKQLYCRFWWFCYIERYNTDGQGH